MLNTSLIGTINNEPPITLIKFAYVGEFTSRRRQVGVGEFARRRVDRTPLRERACRRPTRKLTNFGVDKGEITTVKDLES